MNQKLDDLQLPTPLAHFEVATKDGGTAYVSLVAQKNGAVHIEPSDDPTPPTTLIGRTIPGDSSSA